MTPVAGALFAVGVGLLSIASGMTTIVISQSAQRYSIQKSSSRSINSEQPWQWTSDWARNKFDKAHSAATMPILMFGGMWLLVIWAFSILLIADELNQNAITYKGYFFLFVLIGLGAVGLATIWSRRQQSYGESTMHLAVYPGIIGGPFVARIVSSRALDPDWRIQQTLSCSRINKTADGSSQETVLWQQSASVISDTGSAKFNDSSIPVLFHIPYDLPESKTGTDDGDIVWRLKLESDKEVIDYNTSFVVPVHITPKSSPNYNSRDFKLSNYVHKTLIQEICVENRIKREKNDRHLIYTFANNMGAGRKISFSAFLLLTICAALWSMYSIATWILHTATTHIEMVFPIIFLALSGAAYSIWASYTLSRVWLESISILVSNTGISVNKGLRGLRRPYFITKDDVASISGREMKIYNFVLSHHLLAHTHSGEAQIIGKGIKDAHSAMVIAEDIITSLGIKHTTFLPEQEQADSQH